MTGAFSFSLLYTGIKNLELRLKVTGLLGGKGTNSWKNRMTTDLN